ncbi:MAG TPA: sulfotransferase domain-containing protein [Thermomicrobiales bacterium]|nr:sulfotransferase domain-containing protein [Thermomicrobiales bacterium]
MRIIIASPPKTGNSWLKCLLSNVYGLRWLTGDETPDGPTVDALERWLATRGFPDDAVYHQHYPYSPELMDVVDAIPAHVATILRDPYDMFVSLYFFVQTQADNPNRAAKGRTRSADVMAGRAIDDPESLAFLADGFDADLEKGIAWLASGRSGVVRYEALHADPARAMAALTGQLRPVEPERIAQAVDACTADNLLQQRKGLKRRIRAATVGDWRNHLTEKHLRIMRERHAPLIERLGYDVR